MGREITRELLAASIDAETLYHQAPCGYMTFMPDGLVIKVNGTLLKWLGYTASEVLYQKKFGDFLSKGGQIHYEMFFRPLLNVNGSVKELSYELQTKAGSVFNVLFGAVGIKDGAGQLLAVNAIITDNTDRKRYEQELLLARNQAEREKQNLQFLADLTPDLIWTANPEGGIDYVNARFADYFQLSNRTFIQETVITRIHPDDRGNFIRVWKEAIKGGREVHIDLRLENRIGEYRWHMVKAVPHLNEKKEIVKWFGSCTDIHNHKLALTKKDEFISIASHELKTPLTTLVGLFQIIDRLKTQDSSPKLKEFIERAGKNVKKINALVSELLNVSQLTSGQLHLHQENFDVYAMIDNCCHYVRTEGIFDIAIQGDPNIRVYADAGRIEQVIVNYINNAVKYAPDSGRLVIEYGLLAGELRVSVTDNGPGIPEEKLPHLFDRFYRADQHGSQYSGLGLGLYICAEIIKKHGGRVGADSTLGKGSCFWFTLPTGHLE